MYQNSQNPFKPKFSNIFDPPLHPDDSLTIVDFVHLTDLKDSKKVSYLVFNDKNMALDLLSAVN